MTPSFSSPFSKRRGATAAGIFSVALVSLILLCGAGSVPIENFSPQGPMQADLNAGGHNITNAATINATNFTGSGAGLTSLNGTNITAGTVSTNALSTPVQPYNAATTTQGNAVVTGIVYRNGTASSDAPATPSEIEAAIGSVVYQPYSANLGLYAGVTPNSTALADLALAPKSSGGFLTGRMATIVIAATDSVDKTGADVVCTGTADQTAINAAIATLTTGGVVLFRNGTYTLTAPIVVDQDWVTLQGEGKPHWDKYNGAYPIHATAGTPGGTKFVQTTSGQNGLTVGTTTANMHGDTRHHGIAFRNLYLVGLNYNGTGIYDYADTDISEISNCAIQGFGNGIDIWWDAPQIANNSIQDDAGFGIRTWTGGYGGTIQGNVCFDLGANGIWVNSQGTMVYGNTVGDVLADGIAITNKNVVVHGNVINGVPAGHGIVLGYFSGYVPSNVVISGNLIVLTGQTIPNQTANTSIDGIGIGVVGDTHAINGCSVTGNTVINTATSSTGYAICCRNGSTGNTISGNMIVGPAWNSNSASTILWGTGNFGSGMNAGDNGVLTGSGAGITGVPQIIASGTATLTSGAVTISAPNVTATSLCVASVTGASISANAAAVYPSTIVPGASGTVTFKCANAASADTIAWKVLQ